MNITVPLVTDAGTCQTCSLGQRPLWLHQEKRLCASCIGNTLAAGEAVTYEAN